MKAWYLRCIVVAAFSLAAAYSIWQPGRPRPEPPDFRQLACHDKVHCVAFSPDGQTLAAAGGVTSRTGEIKLWDLADPRQPRALSGHQRWVMALTFAPDGRTLGTASYDVTQCWDLAIQQPVGRRREDFNPLSCLCLAFRPDLKQLAVAGFQPSGPTLRLRNIPPEAACPLPLDCPESITALGYAPDGRRLGAAGVNAAVHIYDTRTGGQCQVLRTGGASALAFTRDGQGLALGDLLGRVQVWDLAAPRARAAWVGHADLVLSLAFSPDGERLATGDHSGVVKLWDPRTGTELADYHEHTDAVAALAFSPDGRWLASGSFDTTVGLRRLAGP
jgi:WD40 repeat protein